MDADLFGNLIDQKIALILLGQRLTAENLRLADRLVEIADLGQRRVDGADHVLELRRLRFRQRFQLLGIVVELDRHRLSRLAHQRVGGIRAHILRLGQVFQMLDQIVEAGLQNALALLALGDLVKHLGDLVKAAEFCLHLADLGRLVAIADVEILIPQLIDAGRQRAAVRAQLVLGDVAIRAAVVHGRLVDLLPAVSIRIDIGDVVARHIECLLGHKDAQPRHGERAECRQTAHLSDTPFLTELHKCAYARISAIVPPDGASPSSASIFSI